jgi:hypothetical protein
MVVQSTELPGIHAQLSRHLNDDVGQPLSLARIDPDLKIWWYAKLGHRFLPVCSDALQTTMVCGR